MTDRFDICFARVIGHEGGYTNDSKDRGNWTTGIIGKGELKGTKYGISAMAYPTLHIRNLTVNDAKEIYRKDYWLKFKCNLMPVGVDYLQFDSAVNHGGSQASKFLQAAVGASQDGIIGPKTLQALVASDDKKIATEFCFHRMVFYTNISTFKTYKNGWTRRLIESHAVALADME